MNYIVDKGCWDADDVFTEHNYSNSTVFDCIVYYLALVRHFNIVR